MEARVFFCTRSDWVCSRWNCRITKIRATKVPRPPTLVRTRCITSNQRGVLASPASPQGASIKPIEIPATKPTVKINQGGHFMKHLPSGAGILYRPCATNPEYRCQGNQHI